MRTEGKLDLTPRRSRRLSSVGYSRSKQDPRHYSWAVAAYALRSGRPHKGRLEVLALLRFRGLLNPVKHPAARLDNGTGFDPVSSHPIGYGTRLSVLFRPVLWEQGRDTRGCLPAFAYLLLAQLVGFSYSRDLLQGIPAGWRWRGFRL